MDVSLTYISLLQSFLSVAPACVQNQCGENGNANPGPPHDSTWGSGELLINEWSDTHTHRNQTKKE